MSKLADQLREHKIFNNWNLLNQFGKTGDVVIDFNRPSSGLAGIRELWGTAVWSIYKHPALTLPTRLLSTRTFQKEFFGPRKQSFPAALVWAHETFGSLYAPSPFGGHIPLHIKQKAIELVNKGK